MIIQLLMQIDIPTPTPIPTNAAVAQYDFEIPSSFTHDAIMNGVQVWNTLNVDGNMEIVQAGFLLFIIFAGLGMVIWAVRRRN